jgi:chaperonin cofactor prefoldin
MSINSVDTTNPATCRANPNSIQTLTTGLQNCMRGEEKARTNTLASNTLQLKSDIDALRGNVMDSLSLGDTIFGQFGHNEVSAQLKKRNEDLTLQVQSLTKEIDKNQAIVDRSNRDFVDVKRTLPEKEPKKILHFIEDYTMALLSISYLFMVFIGIYYYSMMNGIFDTSKCFQAIGYSGLLSIIIGMILYYIC